MKYFILVWYTKAEVLDGQNNGAVYGWYESLATALHTLADLERNGTVFSGVVAKLV